MIKIMFAAVLTVLTGTTLFAILPHKEIPVDTLVAVPSFETASLYFKIADQPKFCKTEFRKKTSTKWKKALNLVYSKQDKMLRGTIAWLQENTEYEARLTFTKANRKKTYLASFKTLSPEVPIKKSINIKDIIRGGSITITEKGSENGWIKYTAPEGFSLKSNTNAKAAISITNAEYIILENLTIEGGQRFGIDVVNSQNIRIINCDISGWGRVGKHDLSKDGKYYLENGRVINYDGGININNSGNMLVERCYIHDPRGRSNSWRYSHPAGPAAITIRSTGGVVLRYNDFIGSDPHRWNDAIEGLGNGLADGGFYRDSDIYGNMLAFGNDDGIEIDGGQMNVRVWQNKFEGFFCGISTAACVLGPSYSFRNLIANLGDESGNSSNAFKHGSGKYATTPGQFFFFNNTIFSKSHGYGNFSGNKKKSSNRVKGTTRNNLYNCRLSKRPNFPMRNDLDYDLFWSGDPDNDLEARLSFNIAKLEKNAVYAKPDFVDVYAANFALKRGSKGIDQGTVVDNFVELYSGKAPDIGAFEKGKYIPLPFRPIPVFTDKYQLNFEIERGKKPKGQKVTVSVKRNSPYAQAFNIRKNNVFDWFTVSPSSGILKDGEKIEFQVKLNPEKMARPGLYRGLFLIRQKNGYSRPVTVYAKIYGGDLKKSGEGISLFAEAEKPVGKQMFKLVHDKKTSAGKYLSLVPESTRKLGKKNLEYQFTIPKDGKYQILLRIKSQSPVGAHDSVFLSIDNDTPKIYNLLASTDWIWSGGNRDWKSGKDKKGRLQNSKSFSLIKLKKGKHRIKIYPRESLSLDLIVVTNEPKQFILY